MVCPEPGRAQGAIASFTCSLFLPGELLCLVEHIARRLPAGLCAARLLLQVISVSAALRLPFEGAGGVLPSKKFVPRLPMLASAARPTRPRSAPRAGGMLFLRAEVGKCSLGKMRIKGENTHFCAGLQRGCDLPSRWVAEGCPGFAQAPS